MRIALASVLLLVVACGAPGAGDDTPVDGGAGGPVTLTFVSPHDGDTFTREGLDDLGFLVADVPIELTVDGSPARIVVTRDQQIIAELATSGLGSAGVSGSGAATLVAIAYDAADHPVASAEVAVQIEDPVVADCHAWLDLYGLTYETGPVSPGVDDPITATTPINGMAWRYVENEAARTELFGGCELIRSVAEAAPFLRRRGITEVADIGVYNYRCIGGVGTPPDCPNGISQHAYANAIDLAGFTYDGGEYATVLDDFVIDPDGEETCEAATEPGKDTFLHELICELKANHVWTIVLTPNYNADHRNHFHVDLTPGADTIHRDVDPGRAQIIPGLPTLATLGD